MLMKEALTVFQADWAATPAMTELKPNCFKNKTVLVSGHEIARDLGYTLLMLNDKLNLNIKVVYAAAEAGTDADIPDGILERDDFIYCELSHVSALKQKPDYTIHTGLCAHKTAETMDEFAAETKAVKDLVKLAAEKKTQRVVLLSDSHVYGKGSNKYRSFSETESGVVSADDYSVQLMRTVENMMSKLCADAKLPLITYRTGVVLAAGSDLYNGLDEVFKAVAQGREISLYSTANKVTFTYMNDVTNAVVYALEKKLTGTYNLSGVDST
ncbi:MAG: NAD(P)-dependent oxidoreductase, partial [Ruminococcus sp.]|nr:NAD(P)-dependent oxidoreductase [Ruminococcus sp.]